MSRRVVFGASSGVSLAQRRSRTPLFLFRSNLIPPFRRILGELVPGGTAPLLRSQLLHAPRPVPCHHFFHAAAPLSFVFFSSSSPCFCLLFRLAFCRRSLCACKTMQNSISNQKINEKKQLRMTLHLQNGMITSVPYSPLQIAYRKSKRGLVRRSIT